MTSNGILGVASNNMPIASRTVTGSGQDPGFALVMSVMSLGADQPMTSSTQKDVGDSPPEDSWSKVTVTQKSYGSGYAQETTTVQNEQELQEPKDPELLSKWQEGTKKLLTEELGITQEELEAALELLGLTLTDLQNPEDMTRLMTELMNVTDTTELLFSDTFRELIQGMEELTNSLADETGMSQEQLKGLLMQLEQQTQQLQGEPQPEIAENDMFQQELLQQEISGQEVMQQSPTQEETVAPPVSQETGTPDTMVKQPEVVAQTQVQEQQNLPQETQVTQEQLDMEEPIAQEAAPQEQQQESQTDTQQSGNQGMAEHQGMAERSEEQIKNTQHTTYQTVQTTTYQQVGQEIQQVVEQHYVNVDDIMDQITRFTRITVDMGTTSIEMQLEPANLGKLYLQVASRDGVITAQLAAQNETVKQALETQVAQLKENLNQQGLKVEAVEVTIASHEFQQNQQNQNQEQMTESGNRRFLTEQQLDELTGSLSPEEDLAARIMQEQGNSMDMTV